MRGATRARFRILGAIRDPSAKVHTMSDTPIKAPFAGPHKGEGDRLERFHRVKRWLARVPYGVGARVFAVITANPLIQFLMRAHRARMRVFMREQGLDLPMRLTFARYLASNYMAAWRLSSLARCDDAEFDRWVRLRGYEHFRDLRAAGTPIILCNSHYGSGKTVLLALLRRGHDIHSLDRQDVFAFFGIAGKGHLISINLGPRDQNFMLKQIFRARNALAAGGVLHIAGDGLRGLSGKPLPFLGRERAFPGSVAELALATHAAILPVFGSLDQRGGVDIDILPALVMPDPTLAREDQVACINGQYCALLEARWRADPGAIFKSEYAIYAGLPELADRQTRTAP